MASVKSPVRTFVKPFLFKLLGKRGYKYAQFYGKMRDIKHRLVEEKEMELLPYFVKRGDVAIDVGANYAYYTDRLSALAGNEGKVFAFEPIPFTCSVCEMIVKSKKLANVSLFNLGISDKNQTLKFSIPKLSYGPISAGQAHIATRTNAEEDKKKYYNFNEEEEVVCDVVALDTFNLELAGKTVSFIKIDIEGAEYFALKGMEQLIKKHLPVVLIEVQPYFLQGFNIDAAELQNYINQTLGYDFYYYDEGIKKLKPLESELFDANFILIPKNKIDSYQQIIYDK